MAWNTLPPDSARYGLEWNCTTNEDKSATFLGITATPTTNGLKLGVFDKAASWSFPVIRYPSATSNVPAHQAAGVYTGQLTRYTRICNSWTTLKSAIIQLTLKMLQRGHSPVTLARGWTKLLCKPAAPRFLKKTALTHWFRRMVKWALFQLPHSSPFHPYHHLAPAESHNRQQQYATRRQQRHEEHQHARMQQHLGSHHPLHPPGIQHQQHAAPQPQPPLPPPQPHHQHQEPAVEVMPPTPSQPRAAEVHPHNRVVHPHNRVVIHQAIAPLLAQQLPRDNAMDLDIPATSQHHSSNQPDPYRGTAPSPPMLRRSPRLQGRQPGPSLQQPPLSRRPRHPPAADLSHPPGRPPDISMDMDVDR